MPRKASGHFSGLTILALVWLVSVLRAPAAAQDYVYRVGTPTFTTAQPVEMGLANLGNGNVHLEIPLTQSPQRGSRGLSASLVYDSRIWKIVGTSWQPTNVAGSQGGWRLMTSADPGTRNVTGTAHRCGFVGNQSTYTMYSGFSWTAPNGTQHDFPIVTISDPTGNCFGGSTPSGDALAADSTGYHMYVTQFTSATVFAPDGAQVFPSVKDPNGNYFSIDANGNVIDTLGRTRVTKTVNGNQTYYDVLNSQNSNSRTTVTTTTINVNTNFGQSGVTEYSGTLTVVQSIALPDGTSYTFSYDSGTTPGNFGILKTMTLPTGGVVNYAHATFSDSYSNRNRWLSSRTSASGTWGSAQAVITTCQPGGTGCQQKVTATDPMANDVVQTFTLDNGAWRAQTQRYNGSAGTGTLLKTVANDFDFSDPNGLYIRIIRSTSTEASAGATLTRKTEYTYDSASYGNVIAVKDWKYYTGTPSATPDRETDYTYLATSSYIAANILNRPTSVVLKNSAGTQIALTNYTYDSTTLTSVTGITHHDDTNFGTGNTVRGNRTLVQRWVSGTTYLNTTNYYDTTGQLGQMTDAIGNATTYSYTDNFYNDNGSNPPSTYTPTAPTNAYLTQITLPISGNLTFGYYFNTGKRAFSKDQNSADTYFHYLDSLDRQTHTYRPLTNGNRGWTLTQYTSATQRDAYSSINDTSPSPACSSCRHDETILDGLGRLSSQVLASDPEGATTTARSYDTDGHVQSVTNPYRSTSDPTYGVESYTYDGVGRVTQTTRADSAAANRYYGADVSSHGGAGTQLCSSATYGLGYPVLTVDEAGKKQQQWTDGFGNIIEVDEPDSSNNLTLGTCYQYDVAGNLTQIVQGTETRTFTYDGLSRKTVDITPEGEQRTSTTPRLRALCVPGTRIRFAAAPMLVPSRPPMLMTLSTA